MNAGGLLRARGSRLACLALSLALVSLPHAASAAGVCSSACWCVVPCGKYSCFQRAHETFTPFFRRRFQV
jgi:hypothetical protein